jgi:hypothetical protein
VNVDCRDRGCAGERGLARCFRLIAAAVCDHWTEATLGPDIYEA